MSYALAQKQGANVTYGALIEQVVPGGPAGRAGLRAGNTMVTLEGTRYVIGGDIIVSLAGIAVNLGLFVASTLLFAVVGVLGGAVPALTATLEIVQRMLWWGMWLNVVLAFFNLIPVPPLDGSHVFYYLLPPGAGLKYRQLQAFGFLPVMVLVWAIPGVLQVLLWPAYHLMGVGVALVGGFAVSPGALPL